MTAFSTCRNCVLQRKICNRRDELRANIKGFGITSLKFNCHERRSLYQFGDRVSVTWSVPSSLCGEYDECDWSLETWPATVTMESSGKFVIRVDDVKSDEGTEARDFVKNENLFCRVSPSKLKPIDEPRRLPCSSCLEPLYSDGGCRRCEVI